MDNGCLSNSEEKILTLSDMVSTVAWIQDSLHEIESEFDPPLLLEDNKTARVLVTNCPAGRVQGLMGRM